MTTPDRDGDIGSRLRKLREMAKPELPARELDRLAGKTQGHASWIESHPEASVLTETIEAYAKVFDVDPAWLAWGAGREPGRAAVSSAVDRARTRGPVSKDVAPARRAPYPAKRLAAGGR
jgi:transcriptional regulator with XRE-family HTH domain